MIFDLVTLTLKFDLLLKNFNRGCYFVMVTARRASLSSDNSYYFSSDTAERDSKKFDRKQDLNIFYQVVFFSLMSK